MIQGIDYAAVSPVLILTVAAIGLLVADAFGVRARLLGTLCGCALSAALVAVFVLSMGDRRATFCLPSGLRDAAGPPSCSYVADDFTLLFQGIVLVGAVIVVLLSLEEISTTARSQPPTPHRTKARTADSRQPSTAAGGQSGVTADGQPSAEAVGQSGAKAVGRSGAKASGQSGAAGVGQSGAAGVGQSGAVVGRQVGGGFRRAGVFRLPSGRRQADGSWSSGAVSAARGARNAAGRGGGRALLPAGEYYFLLLAAIVGALSLVAARDLVLLVVALETLSLPVFALVALRRYDGAGAEAALKLFLVSVISAAVMLFGISLVYGVTGAMHLDRVAPALARTPEDLKPAAAVGVVLVLVGFGFKVAAVPFHFWAPDVYQGAPLPVAAFLSVVSKAAGFAGLAIVLALGFPSYGHVWGPLIAVLSAVTMTVGNLVALRQRYAIRLLAWSSVAQSGYMLAPLAVGDRRLPEAVAATVAYVALYAVMNLGAFAVVTGFRRRTAGGGSGGTRWDSLEDFRGLARRSPAAGAALAFFLICLAGLPPGVMGLFAKIVIFRATVAGDVTWLAVVMAINTVIGLYYYLAWAAQLFAPAAGGLDDAADPAPYRSSMGGAVGAAIAATAAGAVVLSVTPQLVLQTVTAAT